MSNQTVKQLLQRFPKGFAVGPDGTIYEVMEAQSKAANLPDGATGYLAVHIPVLLPGDEFYGQSNGGMDGLTPQQMADTLDRLIKLADTVEEDEILSKLYKTYSERLAWAVKELLR